MFSFGNKKLPSSTMIFNMTSAHDCPSRALGLCRIPADKCYARKAEVTWPATMPYRRRQAKLFKELSINELIGAFKCAIMHRDDRSEPVKQIRFSESGDFESYHALNKITKVFKALKVWRPHLVIYGYTARNDMDFTELQKVATVNGSNKMLDNYFQAVETTNKGDVVCPGDCNICNLCAVKGKKHIKIKFH